MEIFTFRYDLAGQNVSEFSPARAANICKIQVWWMCLLLV